MSVLQLRENRSLSPYQTEPFSAWSRRAVFFALAVTAAIFLLLPLLEAILMQSRRQLSLRRVDTIKTFHLPPKQPPPKTRRQVKRELPKPKLAKAQKRLVPLQIATGLMLDMGEGIGDFALNFGMRPAFADEGLVFELSEVDHPPYAIVQVPPFYPITARAKGVEGKVELIFVVRSDGSVDSIEVLSSSPGDTFVKAAINAVKQWKFKPGTKGGRVVATRVLSPLKFKLED